MASLLLAVKHMQLDIHNAQMMARIARETAASDAPIKSAKGATAGGDERRLRGIPVVGAQGVGGAIGGTKPHVDGVRD